MRIINALWMRNLKIFFRNRTQIVLILFVPLFLLYVLSSVFKSLLPGANIGYVLSGLVVVGIFQSAFSMSASTIEDIVSGFMKEVLVSPVKRFEICAGQVLSAATIATLQSLLLLIVGWFIGMRYTSAITPVAIIIFMFILGIVMSAFGLLMATLCKNGQTFQVLNVALTVPLTFLCGAYIPIGMLPKTLQWLSFINPLTYATDFFRALSLEKLTNTSSALLTQQIDFKIGSFTVTPLICFLVIVVFGAVFLALSTYFFTKADFTKIDRTASSKDVFSQ